MADILLIQTAIPWNSNADTTVLDSLGYTYKTIDMSGVPNEDIANYAVVLIVNDQMQAFYDNYAANYDKFESYVNNGGVLVFFACDHGWAGGNLHTNLPGNVEVGDQLESNNNIADYSNPIVTGELTGKSDIPLTNADMYSNYNSHNYFVESTLPAGAKVVFRQRTDGKPTLAVYGLGKGKVIASGLTWEFTYDRYVGPGQEFGFGRALADVFKYAFTLASGVVSPQKTLTLGTYPEDNWVVDDRPMVFKHPGDLLDVVAFVSNPESRSYTYSLKFEVSPATALDGSFAEALVRQSAEAIASVDPTKVAIASDTVVNGKRTILVNNLTALPQTTRTYNDLVLRLRINPGLSMSTTVDATVTLTGNEIETKSVKLSDAMQNSKPPVAATSGLKVLLTNRKMLYKRFVSAETKNQISSLWSSVYKLAEKDQAVLYHVDKDDKYAPYDSNDNPLDDWNLRRDSLSYDNDPNTTTTAEHDAVNTEAYLVKKMLSDILERSGGTSKGRYVAILGDDSIIPFFRVFDPTKTVYKYRAHHTLDSVTIHDANNNHVYTDMGYRAWPNSEDWAGQNGKNALDNIYVGRIMGKEPQDLLVSLQSSDATESVSSNVVKLENYERDGNLTVYDDQSVADGYTVVRDIDGVSLDYNGETCAWWDLYCKMTGSVSDKAHTADFMKLFKGEAAVKDFDVFRAMSHGSTDGLYSSKPNSYEYFSKSDLNDNNAFIFNKFFSYKPFFLFDACLVGLADGNTDSFLYSLANLGVRGILAATAVSYSPTRTHFDDIVYREMLSKTVGRAVTFAGGSFNGNNTQALSRWEMNLYGLPWARIKPPKQKNAKKSAVFQVGDGQRLPMQQATILKSAKQGTNAKTLSLDASSYNLVKTTDDFDLIMIDGFDLNRQDTATPVLPVARLFADLPGDATDIAVSLVAPAADNISLGSLNIPAYQPPSPVGDPNEPAEQYVATATNLGTLPSSMLSYSVAQVDGTSRVSMVVFPVQYNTATRTASLQKNMQLVVTYTTPSPGVLHGASLDKTLQAPSRTMTVSVSMENTSPTAATFAVQGVIKDYLGNTLDTTSAQKSIASGYSDAVDATITAPSQSGSYTMEVTCLGDNQTLGIKEISFQVESVSILNLNATKNIGKNKYGTFAVTVKNLSDTGYSGVVNYYIYKDNTAVAKLPQLNLDNLAAGEERTVSTSWYPSADVKQGYYEVQAQVEFPQLFLTSNKASFYVDRELSRGVAGVYQLLLR